MRRNLCFWTLLSNHFINGFKTVLVCVQAAITKIPQTGWLKQQTFIAHSSGGLEAGKSKIKALADSVSGESSLSSSYRWLSSHCVLTWQKVALWGLFYKALIPLMRVPPSWPNHLPKAHLLIPSHWELGFQHTDFGGDTDIQPITKTPYKWSRGVPSEGVLKCLNPFVSLMVFFLNRHRSD